MTIVATAETRVVDAGRRSTAAGRAGLLCISPVDALSAVVEISGAVTRIGSDPGCQIALQGESLAETHAVIERADGQFCIRDCGSLLGTFVNDQRIGMHRLMPGDRIRLGNRIFRFLSDDRFDAQYHEAVYEMMTVDALTGAYNRRYFEEAFAREVLRAQRHWRPIALLLLDIDRFGSVNDRFGRNSGDECLNGFSRRVCSRIRGEDLFGRMGGEQFAIALTEAPLKQSVRVAQDLRRLVEGEPFLTSRGSVQLTISIGVGFANGQGPVNAHEILKQGRENMYRAKADGRNCVRY
ncbi:MAG: GGDEF domain-containing protein [Planctomycetaceae bacterium]